MPCGSGRAAPARAVRQPRRSDRAADGRPHRTRRGLPRVASARRCEKPGARVPGRARRTALADTWPQAGRTPAPVRGLDHPRPGRHLVLRERATRTPWRARRSPVPALRGRLPGADGTPRAFEDAASSSVRSAGRRSARRGARPRRVVNPPSLRPPRGRAAAPSRLDRASAVGEQALWPDPVHGPLLYLRCPSASVLRPRRPRSTVRGVPSAVTGRAVSRDERRRPPASRPGRTTSVRGRGLARPPRAALQPWRDAAVSGPVCRPAAARP